MDGWWHDGVMAWWRDGAVMASLLFPQWNSDPINISASHVTSPVWDLSVL